MFGVRLVKPIPAATNRRNSSSGSVDSMSSPTALELRLTSTLAAMPAFVTHIT